MWQDEHSAVVDKLPLSDEAKAQIKNTATGVMRRELATGEGPPLELLSADEILDTDWPEPTWAIPHLLPVGLAILAGKPKVGKSWLALQIAQAVSAGGNTLGEQVEAGPALYLALEDTPRRLKERMQKQGWAAGLPADFMPMGQFIEQVGDLRNGGADRLARQIKHRGYRLVVIDTLARSTIGDQNDVVDMTLALDPVQQMAHAHNCAVLMVDHHKKGGGFDPDVITDILGSTAKGAMADSILGLYRERGRAGAKLAITGRDLDEKTLAIKMDWLTGVWQPETSPTGLALTGNQGEILDAIAELEPVSLAQLAEALEKDRGNLFRTLSNMVNEGMILKIGGGKGSKVAYKVRQPAQQ